MIRGRSSRVAPRNVRPIGGAVAGCDRQKRPEGLSAKKSSVILEKTIENRRENDLSLFCAFANNSEAMAELKHLLDRCSDGF